MNILKYFAIFSRDLCTAGQFQEAEGIEMPGAFRLDQRFRYGTRKDPTGFGSEGPLSVSGKGGGGEGYPGDGYFTWVVGSVTPRIINRNLQFLGYFKCWSLEVSC